MTKQTNETENIITLKDVNKTFHSRDKKGKENQVLKDINLEIKQGEIFGIIGKSGAGKSTLVRLINALETADTGEIVVDGIRMDGISRTDLKKARKDIGMVFQNFNLFNFKTVYDNVKYPLTIDKESQLSADEIDTRVNGLLDFVKIKSKAKNYPLQLSGGQKQRVGIARALATNPNIILADEATSALDPETTLQVLRLLRKVNRDQGKTIVLITHTMSIVRLICDRVAIMENGKVHEVGDVDEIFENPQSDVAINFVRTFKSLEATSLEEADHILKTGAKHSKDNPMTGMLYDDPEEEFDESDLL
ncbi:MAG: ATP-binding cassette domain-containing protein [Bifidobacteriaceae bacterium]|jgi:D-methionine transport system ATP-binding protein|nr:ATP-binding cassette domain-containing protein [Bifidobacteriaceae bacterium]